MKMHSDHMKAMTNQAESWMQSQRSIAASIDNSNQVTANAVLDSTEQMQESSRQLQDSFVQLSGDLAKMNQEKETKRKEITGEFSSNTSEFPKRLSNPTSGRKNKLFSNWRYFDRLRKAMASKGNQLMTINAELAQMLATYFPDVQECNARIGSNPLCLQKIKQYFANSRK